jgi:hypothetical protein
MRKVLVVLAGLVLSTFLFSCSEDDTTVTPEPTDELSIVTASTPSGYLCTPYSLVLEAEGGTEPYTWSLSAGSALPTGLSLSADGELVGVAEEAGDFTFTIECTDDAGTPATVDQEYNLNISVPVNPSLAIFFDETAGDCSGITDQEYYGVGSFVDCFVFIMLDESTINCTRGCEFMITVKDTEGNELEYGTDFMYINFSTPTDLLYVGSLQSGIGIVKSGGSPLYGPEPIHVATFGLLLFEQIDDLTFEFQPNPSAFEQTIRPTIALCDDGYPLVEVDGRVSAVNWQ